MFRASIAFAVVAALAGCKPSINVAPISGVGPSAGRSAPERTADRLALIGVADDGFREWIIAADLPAGECVRALRARYAAGLDGACVHASRLTGYVNGD